MRWKLFTNYKLIKENLHVNRKWWIMNVICVYNNIRILSTKSFSCFCCCKSLSLNFPQFLVPNRTISYPWNNWNTRNCEHNRHDAEKKHKSQHDDYHFEEVIFMHSRDSILFYFLLFSPCNPFKWGQLCPLTSQSNA